MASRTVGVSAPQAVEVLHAVVRSYERRGSGRFPVLFCEFAMILRGLGGLQGHAAGTRFDLGTYLETPALKLVEFRGITWVSETRRLKIMEPV